jgi:hypothetical protein
MNLLIAMHKPPALLHMDILHECFAHHGVCDITSCSEKVIRFKGMILTGRKCVSHASRIGVETLTKLESNTHDALLETMGKEGTLSPEIKQACMMLGIAVMSDIRMVVREELARVGLKPPIFSEEEKKDVE